MKVQKPDKAPADPLELLMSIQLQDADLDKVLGMAAGILEARLVMDKELGG